MHVQGAYSSTNKEFNYIGFMIYKEGDIDRGKSHPSNKEGSVKVEKNI